MRAVHGVELDMDLSGHKPIRKHPYKLPPAKAAEAKARIDAFLEEGLVSPVVSDWAAPALLVPKPNTSPVEWRLVADYRELNKLIAHDTFEPRTRAHLDPRNVCTPDSPERCP